MKLFILLLYSILIIAPNQNETYVIDTKESVVTWKGWMLLVPQNEHTGYVDVLKGELILGKDRLTGGTVQVDMNTLVDEHHESDNNLIDHLKSPDFFDAKKFPTSTFVVTGFASGYVTGDLTIKGITHAVTFPLKMEVAAGVVKASGKLTIDRTKWEVRYGSGMFFSNLANETISDDIEINVKIVARKN